ncbi:MAG: adenosylmethionine--8-amino-7-oxononanoate transaminase [Opitutales bacterium]|nr:adenosylmethionine--8-amino-7-oxononanoate transaminase [Opitutales bacterium]
MIPPLTELQIPLADSAESAERDAWDREHAWHPFAQTMEREVLRPLSIARGKGCWLFDREGNRYLDGNASTWTNVHGHGEPALNEAIVEQLDRVAHSTYLGLAHDPATLLSKRLAESSPSGLEKVFYSDNGSTSVEVALKQSLRHWQLMGQSERSVIVVMEGGYHGDTFGTMALGADGPFTEPWRRWSFPVRRFKAPVCLECGGEVQHATDTESLDSLTRILQEEKGRVAALVLEPSVQGAAGMMQQPPGFAGKVEALCREAGAHLILDEVFVAFGRLGSTYVCASEGVQPDFLCLAKGLTGGYLPLAATLTTNEVFDSFTGPFHEHKTFYHGHTYTANPLGAAVALRSCELLEDRISSGAVAKTVEVFGRVVSETFSDHPRIRRIRQRGLTACLELCPESGASFPHESRFGRDVCLEARGRGLLLRPLGNSLPLVPPIVISDEEISFLCSTALEAIEATLY